MVCSHLITTQLSMLYSCDRDATDKNRVLTCRHRLFYMHTIICSVCVFYKWLSMKREPSRFAGSNVQISCTRLGSAHVFILIRSNKCTLGGTGFLLILQVETIFIYKPIITNHTLPQGASQFMRHIYPSLLDKETPLQKKLQQGKKGRNVSCCHVFRKITIISMTKIQIYQQL